MSTNSGDEKVVEARKLCYNLQSEDKRVRKLALIELRNYLLTNEFSDLEMQSVFNETHIYTLKAFRDKTEAVRSEAIKFMQFFVIDKLPKNDYYLTYLFPVFVERIGTVELVEESEEIRLELLQFVREIIVKYSNTVQLKPFLNDCVSILCETVKDKHPAVKDASCKCITQLADALPRDFHMQAESLVKPVLTAFTYQRFKIRLEAVKCMGDIVMHSPYKALEEAAGPMAERLFDQIPAVRQMVAQVASRWLLNYRDRYSYFHKLLPLILTGLNDEIPETREKASALWQTIGLQYERENESDLKDQMDYLTTLPKYYPENLIRPNLGCRALVQRCVCNIAPALARELSSWQGDVRVRCSQLLCAVAFHAEEYLTQHLQDLLPAMYTAARDEDQRVVVNVLQAGELIGLFVPVETWCKLILPAIEDGPHYGQLAVLSSLIKGTPCQYIKLHLEDICKLLAEDSICQSRKCKYQLQLVKCVRTILSKCNQEKKELGEYIFRIIVTVVALRDSQNQYLFDLSLLEDLQNAFGFLSVTSVWSEYSPNLLKKINVDPKSWTSITVERCIFESFLLESGMSAGLLTLTHLR
uniref:TOG domain-containing protein n=1 Tax=Photinus pyralis TaxID=7054 RepID=A0A1Y1LC31_PHOPY